VDHDHRPGRFAEPSTDRIPVVPQLPDQRPAGSEVEWEPSRAWTPTKIVALVVIALVVLGSAGGAIAGALS
jgi:hypothetical protein